MYHLSAFPNEMHGLLMIAIVNKAKKKSRKTHKDVNEHATLYSKIIDR